jgi:hypothetical protein
MRRLPRGDQAEDHSGCQRNQPAEREGGAVERDALPDSWQIRRAEADQRVQTNARQRTPRTPPIAASTKLSSSCRINAPRPAPSAARTANSRVRAGRTRQQQAGNVGAPDEAPTPRSPATPATAVANGRRGRHATDGLRTPATVPWIAFRHPAGDQIHFSTRLFQRHTWFEAGIDREVVRVPFVDLVRLEGQWSPCSRSPSGLIVGGALLQPPYRARRPG